MALQNALRKLKVTSGSFAYSCFIFALIKSESISNDEILNVRYINAFVIHRLLEKPFAYGTREQIFKIGYRDEV